MSRFRSGCVALALLGAGVGAGVAHAQSALYPGLGRAATPAELSAWDIDVRPDFKGLPKGSGSVARGMEVWESKCASCHGIFGENNEVFQPIVGGTTPADIQSGRVARLNDSSFPGRTTLMKLSTLSTLWDYINRAMPWNNPKSLSTEEVYGVTAYILNMGGIVPEGFTLSDQNITDVQQRLPNRNGMTTDHALWPGSSFGKPKTDVAAVACMNDCATQAKITSSLPDFARNAHGNLAEQNRAVGAQRGADTSRPPLAALQAGRRQAANESAATPAAPTAAKTSAADSGAAAAIALTQKHTCVACHGLDNKIVGPSFREIASKYTDRSDAALYLASKMRAGGSGVWGAIPMPAQALAESDAMLIAQWLANGASK